MPLTVGQLKRFIEKFDACTVAFCIDAEGNGHKHVHTAYEGVVTHDHGWKPIIATTDWSANDVCLEEMDPRPEIVIPKGDDWLDDDDARKLVWTAVLKHAPKVLVLYPVN
jgi:hypothetical protein